MHNNQKSIQKHTHLKVVAAVIFAELLDIESVKQSKHDI